MNRNPFEESWEDDEPSEYKQDLDAAEAAGQPWFSYDEWAVARLLQQLRRVPVLVSADPDQDSEI